MLSGDERDNAMGSPNTAPANSDADTAVARTDALAATETEHRTACGYGPQDGFNFGPGEN